MQKRLKMEQYQAHPRKHPILVSQGISEDGIQALFKVNHGLVQKRIIFTTPVPRESGLMMTPYQQTQDKCGNEPQTTLQTSASKLINLIPNHHTRITRFNAHHRFRVNCVIGWHQTWEEDPSPPCRKVEGLGDSLPSPQRLYALPYKWDGWGTADWVA